MSVRPHPRGPRRASAIFVAAALGCTGVTVALPATAADLVPVPKTDYTVHGVDSEAGAWPAPPALDGTAAGAFDGDFVSQWVSDYANGATFPHWLAIDLQRAVSVAEVTTSIRPGQAPVAPKDVRVYVTDDAAVAAREPSAENIDAWGEPAATATLARPAAQDEKLKITLSEPVTGRYVLFVATSNHGNGTTDISTGIGEIEIFSDTAVPPIPTDPTDPESPESFTISAGGTTARVAQAFPQVLGYDVLGTAFGGQSGTASVWKVNGTDRTGTTTAVATPTAVTYTSRLDGIDTTITSVLRITDGGDLRFEVTDITGADPVNTLALPGNAFVSASSADDGTVLDRTVISPDSTKNADEHIPVTASTAVGSKNAAYAFVGNGKAHAGIISNATTQASTGTASWNGRITTSITGTGARTAALGSNAWLVHPTGATDERVTAYEYPAVTVYFADDRNDDGAVNWQDAAIRHREVDVTRLGAERVAERVVNRIPFNFASSATNYFDLTLDNTKRIANETDGLGQWVLNKGFGSEGHDSANTDYGDNFNERAGGAAALNHLVTEGKKLNADMSVHVNATEIYPQANSFDAEILSGTPPYSPGWNWLDQSFYIDQQKDLGHGRVLDRFQQLKDAVPELSGVYIDVYYSNGWVAEELADELHAMDYEVATEWGDKFEGNAVWAHWPNDLAYGGKENKGVNSTMVRFIQNAQADIWNDDKLLGQQRLVDAEGWTGNSNWDGFMANVWTQSLPTKFLQHFDLLTFAADERATFTGGVEATYADGTRTITVDGKTVLRGDAYLLPWQTVASADESGSPAEADKMYFFSARGGEKTFDLTAPFAGNTEFDVFQLGDAGRTKVGTATASDGALTLTGDAGVAYVVVPQGGAERAAVEYRDAGLVDPGFNSGSLGVWNPTGDVTLERTSAGTSKASPTGDNIARFGSAASSISQRITGLEAGKTYTFSAQVEIAPTALRDVTVSVDAGGDALTRTWNLSPTYNYQRADSKAGLYFQRGAVSFTAPASGEVAVSIAAAAGDAAVSIDNARIMLDTTSATTAGAVYSEDFEGNQAGWGPFVKGDANGIDDPRTSISQRHDPYTSAAWRNTAKPYAGNASLAGKAVDSVLTGDHSLMAHSENGGVVYRTDPTLVHFEPGHTYRVDFDYQVGSGDSYRWLRGIDEVAGGEIVNTTLTRDPIAQALQTTAFSQTFTAGCGDNSWVGLERSGGADVDFVMDDFTVTDLGAAETAPACATLQASPLSLNPGGATQFTTTFTNAEKTAVENVGVQLTLPEGFTAEVVEADGNLFAEVAAGASVSTTWQITAPTSAAGTTVPVTATATYLANECDVLTASTKLDAGVATRSRIPNALISVSASSEEPSAGGSEGPARLLIDGDASTIWHSRYTGGTGAYPYVLDFDLGAVVKVDGIGYLSRGTHQNGPLKGYRVEVSTDGETYTPVANGDFTAATTWQDVDVAPVDARHVRLTALSSISGNQFGAAAEIAVYGTADAPEAFAPGERPDDAECAAASLTASVSTIVAGGAVTLTAADVAGSEDVDVWLDDPATVIGTIALTDGAGSAEVRIPAGTTPGKHTVTIGRGGVAVASTTLSVTAAPAPAVTVSATSKCTGHKARLSVLVHNGEREPVKVTVSTAVGKKTLTLKPGKKASVTFSVKSGSIAAGTASAAVTSRGATATVTADYAAVTCKKR